MPNEAELDRILSQILQDIARFKQVITAKATSPHAYEQLLYHHIFEEEEHHELSLNAFIDRLTAMPDGPPSVELVSDLHHLKFTLHNFMEHLKISLHEWDNPAERETLHELLQRGKECYERLEGIHTEWLRSFSSSVDGEEGYAMTDERKISKEDVMELFAGSPLSEVESEQLEELVKKHARQQTVGRQFLALFGPLGPGIQSVTNEVFTEVETGKLSLLGERSHLQNVSRKEILTIPLITSDFILYWRDVAQARTLGHAIDFSAAALAAIQLAYREDDLIFHGSPDFHISGILNVQGRITHIRRDWMESGNAFADVVEARSKLLENGHTGPYALIVSPRLYGLLHRVHQGTNVLEIEHVRSIMTAGVYQSQVLKEEQGVLLDAGLHNLDLVISEEMKTAFLEQDNLNYLFRIYEGITPRIKRPTAICTLESLTSEKKA